MEACWIIPKFNIINQNQTVEVYQEQFLMTREYIIVWIACVFFCFVFSLRNYYCKYRADPPKVRTIQLTSSKAEDSRELQLVVNFEDSQKMSFYHADKCGIKRLADITPLGEDDLIPDEPSCGELCMLKLKICGNNIVEFINKIRYLILFVIHNVDIFLEVYFLFTIRVKYYYLALAQSFFIVLPFIVLVIKSCMQKLPKGATKWKKCCDLVFESFGLGIVYDIKLGSFPCWENQ